VTVLFADVMGSMELAEQVETEDWRRLINRFFAILCEGVNRFEGTVDKFTGDGIMALFGAPIAHEDHAQRACFAALALQRELSAYAAELRRERGLGFSVRIGLNSGEVVVGSIGPDLAMEYTAIGHTVGLAQRMEQLAEPGKVYVTQNTAALVEGYLALANLGEFQIKGATGPLQVFELTGVGAARGRLDVSRARGFSRFVGRDEELRILESAFEQAAAGQGVVVGVVGEAGVGKSRLCHEFAERHHARGVPVYKVAGQAHASSVPLLPVLQLLRAYFDIGDQDSERTARERIAGKLLLLDETFAEDLPLMFDFLGVPDPDRRPPRMDPDARQRLLLGLTRRVIHAESANEPVINVFEDLHWIDPASAVFLESHIEAIHSTRSLVVVNFRPEYQASWMSKSYYRQIALSPLGAEAIEAILAELLGPDRSLADLPALIRGRTGGNPFFIEEVVQSLVESGTLIGRRGDYQLAKPITTAAVPASVRAVLAARIDRLPQREKAVLQAAAVIGKEFSETLLARVATAEGNGLAEALRNLVKGEFIYEHELYPEAIYAFVHPLTQEVAYGSQLGDRRAALHAAVATAITDHHPDRLDEWAGLLAQHWRAAGEKLEAARWLARAAAWSGTSDPAQSLRHWREVQEMADSLPESAETTALGLTARIFRLQFGWRLGISHEEAEDVFHEAERMAARSGDGHSRAILLAVYSTIVGAGDGDLLRYLELGRQAFAIAEESGDPGLYVGLSLTAYAMFCTGQLREGMAVLDRAVELADGDPTMGAGIIVSCPLAFCQIFRAGFASYLGELAECRRVIERGMQLAREHGDIETVGWGHLWGAWIEYLTGDPDAALAHGRQAVEIADRLGDSFSRAWASYWLGVGHLTRKEWQQSIEAFERSAAISREHRTAVDCDAPRLALLAEAYLGAGDSERAWRHGQQAVDVAFERSQPHIEAFAIVSLSRVLLASGKADDHERVEAILARALKLATDTGSAMLEPLIRAELAELARQRGDEDLRQQELSTAYRQFSEAGASGQADRIAVELAVAGDPR
jgi:class 3 adenylate cyclase/tetratricopeptide (TPR) repeat protein